MPIRPCCLLALTLILGASLSLAAPQEHHEQWAVDEWLEKPVDDGLFLIGLKRRERAVDEDHGVCFAGSG